VRPWRFKDAKVAEFFALLVRVCAADRDGEGCAHFRGDALFAAAERLYREANAPPDGDASPLGIAFELLSLMEAASPLRAEALLREAVARAAARAAAKRAAARPALPLSTRGRAVARVVDLLRAERPALFSDMEFAPVREVVLRGSRAIRLALTLSGRELVLDLQDARSKKPCFLRSRRFRAVYHGSTHPSPRECRQLSQLLRLLDAGVARV
jgi:hypothetical protein